MPDFPIEQGPGPGGYDASYRQCPCFWGTEPGRMVQLLAGSTLLAGAHVLDLGCGEGKNAAFLASLGCRVEAWDISAAALRNAKATWPDAPVRWFQKDALSISSEIRKFDVVIAYGLYHCLAPGVISQTIMNVQRVTAQDGYNIVVCFNSRKQANIELAHPAFHPTYLAHAEYLEAYSDWCMIVSSCVSYSATRGNCMRLSLGSLHSPMNGWSLSHHRFWTAWIDSRVLSAPRRSDAGTLP
jgi:SAM-dependent methyltransferase